MALNQYGEPMPVKLTGPLARAWERELVVNEWFDGEDGIAAGAQQRLIREWNENKPSRVTSFTGWHGERQTQDFPTRREAERFADTLDADYVSVSPIR